MESYGVVSCVRAARAIIGRPRISQTSDAALCDHAGVGYRLSAALEPLMPAEFLDDEAAVAGDGLRRSQAVHLVCGDRTADSLELNRAHRRGLDGVIHCGEDALADQDLSSSGVGA